MALGQMKHGFIILAGMGALDHRPGQREIVAVKGADGRTCALADAGFVRQVADDVDPRLGRRLLELQRLLRDGLRGDGAFRRVRHKRAANAIHALRP